MRIISYFIAMAIIAVASMSFVVKVDNIPKPLYGYPMTIVSRMDDRTLDSVQVSEPNVQLTGRLNQTELCALTFSYAVEGGVRTMYYPLILENDTVSAIITDYETGQTRVSGGELNAELSACLVKAKNDTNVINLFRYEIIENRNNPLGVYLLSMLVRAIGPREWLALYDALSPSMSIYPFLTDEAVRIKAALSTEKGELFSNINCVLPDGAPTQLADYVGQGKYVLVDFWATWCGPCRLEASQFLVPLYEKYKDDNSFMILGVLTSDNKERFDEVFPSLNYPWPQVIDTDNAADKAYGFNFLPYIILFAPDGTILHRGIRGDQIGGCVAEALGAD